MIADAQPYERALTHGGEERLVTGGPSFGGDEGDVDLPAERRVDALQRVIDGTPVRVADDEQVDVARRFARLAVPARRPRPEDVRLLDPVDARQGALEERDRPVGDDEKWRRGPVAGFWSAGRKTTERPTRVPVRRSAFISRRTSR